MAPTSKPPFEPPLIARNSGLVNLFFIRNSAAAIKSLNTFCFFCDDFFNALRTILILSRRSDSSVVIG